MTELEFLVFPPEGMTAAQLAEGVVGKPLGGMVCRSAVVEGDAVRVTAEGETPPALYDGLAVSA